MMKRISVGQALLVASLLIATPIVALGATWVSWDEERDALAHHSFPSAGADDDSVWTAVGESRASAENGVVAREGAAVVDVTLPRVSSIDDSAPGLKTGGTYASAGSATVTRTLTLLEGTSHADIRTKLASSPGPPLELVTEVKLWAPEDARVAYGDATGSKDVLLDPLTPTTLDFAAKSAWVAVFDPSTRTTAGVVLAGPMERVALRLVDNGLSVTTTWRGVGSLVGAEYLTATDTVAAEQPFEALSRLAERERSEVGTAFLGDGYTAAVSWRSSDAEVTTGASSTTTDFVDSLGGEARSWMLSISADAGNGGKAMRFVVPQRLADGLVPSATLDGEPVGLERAAESRGNASFTLVIPHFSLRTVQIKSVTPGVPPIFMWLTIGLGTVATGGGIAIGSRMLKSKAARLGIGEAAAGGGGGGFTGPRSAAVQRALGSADQLGGGGPAEGALKSEAARRAMASEAVMKAGLDESTQAALRNELLMKLGAPGSTTKRSGTAARSHYARCVQCTKPIRFDPGQASLKCPNCGRENLNEMT
ncbi:MAG: hypothetical protein HY556_11940 [Euryarchaeota archaeon]|nr:hypothetical protein [Euryarchaeota archaeon]